MNRVPTTERAVIAVHDLGGKGPTLLLAHANGFHGQVFRPLVEDGLARRFHCVALDFRGHGDSTLGDTVPGDWRVFADDVLAVVDSLDLSGPLYGFGHSLGGAAALDAERRAEGTFAALYVFEPIVPVAVPDALPQINNPLAEAADRRREAFASWDEAIANFASKPPLDALDSRALRAYVEDGFALQADGTVLIKCRPSTEAANFRMPLRSELADHVEDVKAPVTVATGRSEGWGPAMFAPLVVERLAEGRLERFDHLGHFGPLQAPAEIAAAVIRAFTEPKA